MNVCVLRLMNLSNVSCIIKPTQVIILLLTNLVNYSKNRANSRVYRPHLAPIVNICFQ
ncbi:hypothetical protein BD408DRAFT_421120, partial [Parasitella parasitica]